MTRRTLGTLGLFLVTIWAAVQYFLLGMLPEDVSAFGFIFLTNLVGLPVLALFARKKLAGLRPKTMRKGLLLAAEAVAFNWFLITGARGTESMVTSCVSAVYFVFIPPMLLLLRKQVSFRTGVAVSTAVIALLLIFEADYSALVTSSEVLNLLLADLFCAAYVVTVDEIGRDEDPLQLSFCQMLLSAAAALVLWTVQCAAGRATFALPTGKTFLLTVLFVGVFIRVLHNVVQMAAQKYVPPVNISLILSTEIIFTLLVDPLLARVTHTVYETPTVYQIAGCLVLVATILLIDDEFMRMFGYHDMDEKAAVPGRKRRSSVARKTANLTLGLVLMAMIASIVVCLIAIQNIQRTAVNDSAALGHSAASDSEEALVAQLESELTSVVSGKAALAQEKLAQYTDALNAVAVQASALLEDPDAYPAKESAPSDIANAGTLTMIRSLASEDIAYEDVRWQSALFGNLEPLLNAVSTAHPEINTIYLATEEGYMVSYDRYSYELDGPEFYFEHRERSWYTQTRETGSVCFTDPYEDNLGRGLCITISVPFYRPDGSFAGAVALDLLSEGLDTSMLVAGTEGISRSWLVSPNGYQLNSSSANGVCLISITGPRGDPVLREAAEELMSGSGGMITVDSYDGRYYLTYAVVPLSGWRICTIVAESAVIQPAEQIRQAIDASTTEVSAAVEHAIQGIIENCLVLFAIMQLLVTYFVGVATNRLVTPLKTLEKDVAEISSGNLTHRTQVRSDDEIGVLAQSFNGMTESLQHYIADLREATTREERINAELNVATRIQADMLPTVFPAFPGRHDFDIYAAMSPAKEVGGDFYDFFMTDDDHLVMVMADVSGKGIPAALFMVTARTLLKSRAMMGGSPSEILADVNNHLCEGNTSQLFVTAWLGILELSTGKGLAANAGHEHPALRKKGGSFELLKYRHSPALAVMEGTVFREHSFTLEPGDTLFVYTDGVCEATDSGDNLYGEERMLTALNAGSGLSLQELLHALRRDIDRFVGEAPQFDDLTMMGMTYYGKE